MARSFQPLICARSNLEFSEAYTRAEATLLQVITGYYCLCRRYYDFTYMSCQESHKLDWFFAKG